MCEVLSRELQLSYKRLKMCRRKIAVCPDQKKKKEPQFAFHYTANVVVIIAACLSRLRISSVAGLYLPNYDSPYSSIKCSMCITCLRRITSQDI